jgi:murein DD-endopeptidase MepM/ murein hydrolase activator NlpD
MSRTSESTPGRPSILAYQTAISVLLILAGVFVNRINLSVLKPVKDSMTHVLTENYGLSAVSLAVEEFLQSAGISTDGLAIFDWLEKADDTAADAAANPAAITADDGTQPDAAADVPGTPQEAGGTQETSGTPQDSGTENENDDSDTGHKYSIAASKEDMPVKAVNLTRKEEEPALPANVVVSKFNLGISFTIPVKGTITSGFGYRIHPTLKKVYFHYGTDIGAAKGTSVYASAAGTVEETGTSKVYGKYMIIRHSSNVSTFYGHCSKVSVKKGAKVKAGAKIGEVGSTGLATGSHLHFEIRYDDKYVDPEWFVV